MNDPEPCCDISGTCEAPSYGKETANCIHCGKELQERNGQWYTWDADLNNDPRPQRQSSDLGYCEQCHPTEIGPKDVREVRFRFRFLLGWYFRQISQQDIGIRQLRISTLVEGTLAIEMFESLTAIAKRLDPSFDHPSVQEPLC